MVGAGGIVPGKLGCKRVPCSAPWSPCCSPTVNLQIKSFPMEHLGPRAEARPEPAASQVASIRWWPAKDSRATYLRFMGQPHSPRHKDTKSKIGVS